MKHPKPERFVVIEGIPIYTRAFRVRDQMDDITQQGHAKYTHHCALRRGVAPWLVVRREDTQMAATDELLVVHTKDRVVAVQEIGMEHYLDAV